MRVTRLIVIGALALTACASTTIDPTVTEAPAVAPTTTLPTGTAAELLPRLLSEAGLLSEAIGADEGKNAQMDRISNLYDAVRPELGETDGVAALSFDGAIELCERGAQFNRPADADKCFRNLSTLSEAYLAGHP